MFNASRPTSSIVHKMLGLTKTPVTTHLKNESRSSLRRTGSTTTPLLGSTIQRTMFAALRMPFMSSPVCSAARNVMLWFRHTRNRTCGEADLLLRNTGMHVSLEFTMSSSHIQDQDQSRSDLTSSSSVGWAGTQTIAQVGERNALSELVSSRRMTMERLAFSIPPV